MSDTNDIKMFTVKEANDFLPKLKIWLGDLQALRESILAMEVEIDALELISEKDDSGNSKVLPPKVEAYNQRVNRFYAVVDEIHSAGCLLKDLDHGLVDFCGLYQNRMVHFCWKFGESEVKWWHEIGLGFTSRQPLD